MGRYEDGSARFRLKVGLKTYTQQFSHVYNRRLDACKPSLRRVAEERWPEVAVVDRIVGASVAGTRCVVLGTTFKEMEKRENILDEYRLEYSFEGPKAPQACYASTEDRCFLEDTSGRIALVGGDVAVPSAVLVTGVAMAVCGVINDHGELALIDWCGPGLAPPPEDAVRPSMDEVERPEAPHPRLLLISGLNCGGATVAPLALLCDWLDGATAAKGDDTRDQLALVKSVARCIVAGGLLARLPENSASSSSSSLSGTGSNRKANEKATSGAPEALVPLHQGDVALARLAARVPTVAMPGKDDPTNVALPQQQMHPVLLPQAARYPKTFAAVPNPAEVTVGDRLVLGHSGQPTSNVLKYTLYDDASAAATSSVGEGPRGAERRMRDGATFGDRHTDGPSDASLAALEDSLWWRHVAPTVPDTLAAYPFIEADPFVIDECPSIYFAGNQAHFGTSLAKSADGSTSATRVVCLPSFAETGVCALVDLTTLAIDRLCFNTDALKPAPPPGSVLSTPMETARD